MNTPTVAFYTFGCRLNQAETATLSRSFEEAGYAVVQFGEPADIVVVNTCTVTASGDADTRKLVNRINRQNPDSRIALIGCQSQLQSGALIELPSVCWVVGTARKMELPEILRMEEPGVILDQIPRESFTMPTTAAYRDRTRANLKVQDGCDFYCSYCEVPYARGHARSRVFEDIEREARALIEEGHLELVMTGINIGCYKDGDRTFLDVVKALLPISGLERLRVSSIEPTTPEDEFLELMAGDPKLCRYIHMPMQSASDEILQAMNRRYCFADFAAYAYHAAERVPDVCIGTDVIVGFPGETDEHFEATHKALRELPLAYFHVFSYSDRPNAKARRLLAPKVPTTVITERSQILRTLSQRRRRDFMERFLGITQSVLVEQRKDGRWTGLTDNFIRVSFNSDHEDLHNKMVDVELVKLEQHGMQGRLV